ncbi:MAG TPA: RidA family protein [Chryseosolibacter sp.]|nr:RidA family protein [Chryseosolibacter sp.]
MMKHLITLCLIACISAAYAQQTPEDRLKELGIALIVPTSPVANYVKAVRTGNLIYLSGHGPTKADGTDIVGKVGKDLKTEQGIEAAKRTAISLISTLRVELGGDLSRVKRIVKVNGWVNCTDTFKDQPKVMNGCSDLLVAVFGEKGKHARTSLGTNALPSNIAIEIEMIVEVD